MGEGVGLHDVTAGVEGDVLPGSKNTTALMGTSMPGAGVTSLHARR